MINFVIIAIFLKMLLYTLLLPLKMLLNTITCIFKWSAIDLRYLYTKSKKYFSKTFFKVQGYYWIFQSWYFLNKQNKNKNKIKKYTFKGNKKQFNTPHPNLAING